MHHFARSLPFLVFPIGNSQRDGATVLEIDRVSGKPARWSRWRKMVDCPPSAFGYAAVFRRGATTMRPKQLFLMPALLAATPLPAPPPSLTPYISNGRFDPGDYRWLRGQFANASEADRTASNAIEDWKRRCTAASLAEVRTELAALGVNPGEFLNNIPARDPICSAASSSPWPLDLTDWEGFARDVQVVRPIAQAYLSAVATAEMIAAPRGSALNDAINARSMGEQMLRFGFSWAAGSQADSPVLTPRQRAILSSRISIATIERDHANTEWLKGHVAAQGWPRRSLVGDGAAGVAWLLVQHADADPAFQLRALRLMEPLVETGEVDRKNYAYLYDRVMLKIVGRQRYATQMTCEGGRYVPQPLEANTAVETRRREMGLGTLTEYEQQMVKAVGACPAASPAAK